MKIGFIGTGKITSSIIYGIFKSKLKISKIYISPRNKSIANKLSKKFKTVKIAKNNQEIIDNSSLIFLAVIFFFEKINWLRPQYEAAKWSCNPQLILATLFSKL